MDEKKYLEEDVETTIDYYGRWVNGSEPIRRLIELEDETVLIGRRERNLRVTPEGFKTTKRLSIDKLTEMLDAFKKALDEFVSKWKELVEVIENYHTGLNSEEMEEIQKLLNEKKKTISLAEDILVWMEKIERDGYHYPPPPQFASFQTPGPHFLELRDFEYDKIIELAKNLMLGIPRERIVVTVRMEI